VGGAEDLGCIRVTAQTDRTLAGQEREGDVLGRRLVRALELGERRLAAPLERQAAGAFDVDVGLLCEGRRREADACGRGEEARGARPPALLRQQRRRAASASSPTAISDPVVGSGIADQPVNPLTPSGGSKSLLPLRGSRPATM